MKVFGVDIIKRNPDEFALVYISEDGEEKKAVSKSKLLRIIRKESPDYVAIDNISELFENKNDLLNFLHAFPPSTKLVQVAGKEPLPRLAARFGLKINARNPFDEAKACAYLVTLGIGEIVSAFKDETVIVVSRNRSPGKGGWRQNKYRRRIHDIVRYYFREIKEILDSAGLKYREEVKHGYGGISSGKFVVNAPREEVPIRPFRTRDVRVTVTAVEKEKLEFVPLSKVKEYLIVGVDPGTTTAVAILNLKGEILDVRSGKDMNLPRLIEHVLSFGHPVLIATDKKTPPDFVLKVKKAFQATLYTPKDDISIKRKLALVNNYKCENDHERDALAAAMEAYRHYKNKLENIEKRVPAGYDVEMVKAGIIKGLTLQSILERKEAKVRQKEESTVSLEEIRKRDKKIQELVEENRMLREKIEELKREVERLQMKLYTISSEQYEKIRRENVYKSLQSEIAELRKEIRRKDEEISKLKEKIEELKRIRKLGMEGWKVVKVLRKFTKDEIERVEKEFGIEEGDVILILESGGGGKSTAEILAKKRVKVVFASGLSHVAYDVLKENGIPVIPPERVEMEVFEDLAMIHARELEKILKEAIEEMKKESFEKIEKLVEEYRSKRFFG